MAATSFLFYWKAKDLVIVALQEKSLMKTCLELQCHFWVIPANIKLSLIQLISELIPIEVSKKLELTNISNK